MKLFIIVNLQTNEMAYQNACFVNDLSVSNRSIINNKHVNVIQHTQLQEFEIAMSSFMRLFLGVEIGERVFITDSIELSTLDECVFNVQLISKKPTIIEEEEFVKSIQRDMIVGEKLTFPKHYQQKLYMLTSENTGLLTSSTRIHLKITPNPMLECRVKKGKLQPNFNFNQLGIGGLNKEFEQTFRRVFTSRMLSSTDVKSLGISHVKGLILYGPPGNGKTLIARKIGEILQSRPPKIVNGPEILSKFVGQSEENIRNLFIDAETDYKENGDDADLHIIIFDEFECIGKKRGSTNNGTGVQDTIVNQLLAKMDGVERLNNVLIIGLTNRIEMIDSALLRAGRFEVHIEIGLPTIEGRKHIFEIHTKHLYENNRIGDDVDLVELAMMTENFSGAQIEGVVRQAISSSIYNSINGDITKKFETPNIQNLKVSRDNFMLSIQEMQQ